MSKLSLPKRFSFYLVTQSLGAFNDNLFKMLLQLYVLQALSEQSARGVISDAAFVFTIPFVLFGPWAGYLADRYSKSGMMRAVKFAEIGVMGLGLLSFYLGNVPLMLAILFLMAGQSTFFSPAKYGYIPEVCQPGAVTRANSWVEMTTFVAIIIGTAVAGPLLDAHGNDVVAAAGYCLGIAALGSLFSLGIPSVPATGTREKFPLNPLTGIWADLKFLTHQRGLFLAALANSYFWLIGLIFQTNILIYGKLMLQDHPNIDTLLSVLPGFIGIGIAVGSLMAARLSGGKVEIGLVLLGGAGLAFCGMALYWTHQSYWLSSFTLFLAGGFGGIFIVPLYAYLQYYAQPDEKGRVMAAAGIWNGIFLVLGALIYRLLSVEFGLHPRLIYLFMGLITLALLGLLARLQPEYRQRLLWWLAGQFRYRYSVAGREHLPAHGRAFLLLPGGDPGLLIRICSAIQQPVQFLRVASPSSGTVPREAGRKFVRIPVISAAPGTLASPDQRRFLPGEERFTALLIPGRQDADAYTAICAYLNRNPGIPVVPVDSHSSRRRVQVTFRPPLSRPITPEQLNPPPQGKHRN